MTATSSPVHLPIARGATAALSMITKEKSPIRVLFFRDHEINGAGQA
jgi:hypothetical protein